MGQLFDYAETFDQLFASYDSIANWEPDTDADGNFIDANGNIIENVVVYKEQMLQAWFDTLEAVEGEFDVKAENLACYIKQLKAEAETLKKEKLAFTKRQAQKEKQAEKLTKYLLSSMQAAGKTKIDMPRAVINIKRNAPSLVISDELGLVDWLMKNNDKLLKYEMPTVKKAEVKKQLKAGEEIPFVQLESKSSVTIK